jgi:hypothetical protein
MTEPEPDDIGPAHPRIATTQLWAGGIATAVVAALVALVGVLAARWVFSISILAPRQAGAYGDATTTGIVLGAAAGALLATGLLHLLLLTTPRPLVFFGWILGLATVVGLLVPFSTTAPLSQKIATGLVDMFIGIAIGSLLTSVARWSITRPSRPRRYDDDVPTSPYGGRDRDPEY